MCMMYTHSHPRSYTHIYIYIYAHTPIHTYTRTYITCSIIYMHVVMDRTIYDGGHQHTRGASQCNVVWAIWAIVRRALSIFWAGSFWFHIVIFFIYIHLNYSSVEIDACRERRIYRHIHICIISPFFSLYICIYIIDYFFTWKCLHSRLTTAHGHTHTFALNSMHRENSCIFALLLFSVQWTTRLPHASSQRPCPTQPSAKAWWRRWESKNK